MATLKSGSEKSKIQKKIYFSWVFSGLVRRLTLIFFERKDMMLENVLDTQNMVVGPQEK